MFTVEQLQEFCSRDPYRMPLLNPFLVTLRDEAWTVATDGWILVAVKGIIGEAAPQEKISASVSVILGITDDYRPPFSVNLDSLKEWAGPVERTVQHHECASCKNTGQMTCKCCQGTGQAEGTCNECDYEVQFDCHCENGKVDCDNCDGKGEWDEPPAKRPGLLFGIFLDRNLLGRTIEHLSAATANLSIPHNKLKAIQIQDPDGQWRILVMPMSYKSEDVPRFPTATDLVASPKP